MEHRDKIVLHNAFRLPTIPTGRHGTNQVCYYVLVGTGIVRNFEWIEGEPDEDGDTYGEHVELPSSKALVLAISPDIHHLRLDQEQARALAKVLQYYADTGEVKNNE